MSMRGSKIVYVGNLPSDIREREVEDLFSKVASLREGVSLETKLLSRKLLCNKERLLSRLANKHRMGEMRKSQPFVWKFSLIIGQSAFSVYQQYLANRPMNFKSDCAPIPVGKVEPASAIVQWFYTGYVFTRGGFVELSKKLSLSLGSTLDRYEGLVLSVGGNGRSYVLILEAGPLADPSQSKLYFARISTKVGFCRKPVEVNAKTKQDLRSFKLILEYIKALPMQVEIPLLSPLVSVRQLSFLRLLVYHGHSLLLGSLCDCNINPFFSLLYITWVDHSQYDESLIHILYRPLIAIEESNGDKDAMDLEIRSRGNVVGKLVRTKHHKKITFPLVINSSKSNLSGSRRIDAHMTYGR
ncbi:hypothetical protein AHAS_Ahas09G0115800 [Arachis hypogaea]